MKGASKGEGLGNQFLANIREVDAIAYVLRCFEDDDIIHVEGRIDPIADAETIETELMLADLESLERRVPLLERKIRGGDKEAKTIPRPGRAGAGAAPRRQAGAPRRRSPRRSETASGAEAADRQARALCLQCRRGLRRLRQCVFDARRASAQRAEGAGCVIISARIEAELAQLEEDERKAYLAELGLEEPGLNRLIREGYKLLGLITYFTAGPKEARAWTMTRAPGRRRPPA